jgi:RHS repeat-associated protein
MDTGSSTPGTTLARYVYSGSTMIAKIESGATRYFLSDRLSTRLVLDASANVIGRQGHLPFGEDLGESGTQEKHHFTSFERDGESGSDYAVNRQYNQNVARFLRVDPKRSGCARKNPQRLNRYAYTRSDPLNRTDPLGLDDDCIPKPCGDGKAWDVGECKCNPVPGPKESVNISAGPPDPRFVAPTLGPLASGTMAGEAMEMELPPVTEKPTVDPQPLTCDDCCGTAWDWCWDMLLEELAIITPSAGKAAAKALNKCLGGLPWGSGLNAGCMGARLLDAGIAGQEAIVRAVDHWFQCMGSKMEFCRKEVKDCVCDFGG